MRQIGVTTVMRWMCEELPKNIIAFMAEGNQLYRLKRIRSYAGDLRPVFACGKGEFTGGKIYLDAEIFLSISNLAGTAIADIRAERVSKNCWESNERAARLAEI